MTALRLSPSIRRFLLWTARVAFLAYLVQLVAIDHWHTHPTSITGLEGTSAHVAHCHGAGDCSDGGASISPAPASQASLPFVPPSLALRANEGEEALVTAFAETILQPPQAA
jgi:hypothetical protein